MSRERTLGVVERLRAQLDEHEIAWQEVRDAPQATYLPPELVGEPGYTIWWQGPTNLIFLWGHNFEFKDATPEDVIKRLESL